jgi:hypothetical protein
MRRKKKKKEEEEEERRRRKGLKRKILPAADQTDPSSPSELVWIQECRVF